MSLFGVFSAVFVCALNTWAADPIPDGTLVFTQPKFHNNNLLGAEVWELNPSQNSSRLIYQGITNRVYTQKPVFVRPSGGGDPSFIALDFNGDLSVGTAGKHSLAPASSPPGMDKLSTKSWTSGYPVAVLSYQPDQALVVSNYGELALIDAAGKMTQVLSPYQAVAPIKAASLAGSQDRIAMVTEEKLILATIPPNGPGTAQQPYFLKYALRGAKVGILSITSVDSLVGVVTKPSVTWVIAHAKYKIDGLANEKNADIAVLVDNSNGKILAATPFSLGGQIKYQLIGMDEASRALTIYDVAKGKLVSFIPQPDGTATRQMPVTLDAAVLTSLGVNMQNLSQGGLVHVDLPVPKIQFPASGSRPLIFSSKPVREPLNPIEPDEFLKFFDIELGKVDNFKGKITATEAIGLPKFCEFLNQTDTLRYYFTEDLTAEELSSLGMLKQMGSVSVRPGWEDDKATFSKMTALLSAAVKRKACEKAALKSAMVSVALRKP